MRPAAHSDEFPGHVDDRSRTGHPRRRRPPLDQGTPPRRVGRLSRSRRPLAGVSRTSSSPIHHHRRTLRRRHLVDIHGRAGFMKLRRVPARDAEPPEFLAGANAAFGAWGDAAFFAWVFRDDAEILFLDDADGHAVAGSGITYRTLRGGQRAAERSV